VDLRAYQAHVHDPDLGFDRFISIIVACRHGMPALAAGWVVDRAGVHVAELDVGTASDAPQ
jgi:hypothetical protein